MIIFERIKFKNFLSYGNNFTEIKLNENKTTLLHGKNGFGKSTILDALTFALFGKPFRKVPKNGLLNSINKSDLLVELEFSIGEKSYKIVRGIKPNIFELYLNDNLIKQEAAIKDYQEYLEKYIIKTNFKSFIQVVILGSARYTPFMQLSASDRRTVIEDLLDIQIFSDMNVVVKDKLSSIKESINDCKYNIELYKDKIQLQKHNIEENKKSSKDLILKKQEILQNTLNDIEVINSTIESLQNKNQKYLSIISDKTQNESKKQKLLTIESKLKDSIKKIEKENLFYQDNDTCPTCKQNLSVEFKTEVIEKNSVKKQELIEGSKKLISDLKNVKTRLEEISVINGVISNNNIEIAKLHSTINSSQKYTRIISEEIEQLNNYSNNLEEDNAKLQELIEKLDYSVEEYEKNVNEKSYYDFISLILKDGGIKTKIVKQYLPILNKYINQYLKQMDFFVNFNIDENFEEVIKSRHRDEFRYANFSEGEKTRLDLAILFSFRQISKLKNSINTNLLIFDEIMDGSLDSSGTDIFTNIISNLDSKTNVLVISHKNDQIADKFDRILSVEKVKNFSRIKETK